MNLPALTFRAAAQWSLLVVFTMIATVASAQDVNAGRVAYTTPLVSGMDSCSASTCHALNPLGNQNRILNAADNPGAIGQAIKTYTRMAFLKNKLSSSQFADLAAYIASPGAVTGSPSAALSPASLAFPSTVVGSSAAAQMFAIDNTGTAALVVSGVSSSNADFSVLSSCGSIAAGSSCNLSVGFTPSVAGAREATISVTHNAPAGTSSLTVSGTAATPVVLLPGIEVTPVSLSFGSINVGSFSGVQLVTVTSVGTAPLVLSTLTVTGSSFVIAVGGGSCTVNAPLAVGSSCTVPVRLTPTSAGTLTATLGISHNAGASAATVSLSGTGVASPPPNLKTMIEYVYVPLNYYFITSRISDMTALAAIDGFQRTGLSFPVYAAETGDAKAISRFYFDQIAVGGSRGSHFYTLLDADKAALAALNPSNTQAPRLPHDEGIDSWAYLPVAAGVGGYCASGQMPVYRLFRGGARFPDDPNHRFTADTTTYNRAVAQGWDGEGVSFCVPAL